ncbi:hemerythrin domain-containing protein [Streptomyces sp. NBC_00370]|uniref:hemerythrin domain-containing protein n=1 Tax=Streptomyces sp. NBC_00370 TaxID=2975728 RepID=UPI002E257D4C
MTGGADTEKIDFIMMYATHNAFRRDLGRIQAAAAGGRADTPQTRAGWRNFKHQLHIHHTVEDDTLWPRLRAAVTDPADLALLDEMEAEHALIDPLLAAVDAAMDAGLDAPRGAARDDRPDVLPERLRELSDALGHHLVHEEISALPLIQAVLTPADWAAFGGQMRRAQGVKGAAVYIPWILDGRPRVEQRQFLAALPPPARLVNRLFWQSRYAKLELFGGGAPDPAGTGSAGAGHPA